MNICISEMNHHLYKKWHCAKYKDFLLKNIFDNIVNKQVAILFKLHAVFWKIYLKLLTAKKWSSCTNPMCLRDRVLEDVGEIHFDNFQSSHWWKFHQNNYIYVSVLDKHFDGKPFRITAFLCLSLACWKDSLLVLPLTINEILTRWSPWQPLLSSNSQF